MFRSVFLLLRRLRLLSMSMSMSMLMLVLTLLVIAPVAQADILVNIGGRTVNVHVPPSYDGTPMPVVMLLHGYTSTGALQESYMQFETLADQEGFLYLHPDGTVNCLGEQFWNATDACCEFCASGVDDVAFLSAVLDEIEAQLSVDTDRVYLIGHSNGGFMSYRMACDQANRIAAIVSLAGATWFDPLDCNPAEPVHVLQIHGDLDATILYPGGNILGTIYPSASVTTETWAGYAGCTLVPDTSSPNLDLEGAIAGSETTVARYEMGCMPGGSAELWTIVGGGHVPTLSGDFSSEVIDYLLAHPKPIATPAVPTLSDHLWLVLVLMSVGVIASVRKPVAVLRAAS
jgi:polyhydroxybutyrate depolymerase